MAVGVVTIGSACTEPSRSGLLLPEEGGAQASRYVEPAELDWIARSLAFGLSDSVARHDVLVALQQSDYTEHKLVLQDFVKTDAGDRLLTAAAGRAKVDSKVLRARILRQPNLDFYAPFMEHRVSWSGGANVVVAATPDVDSLTVTAFNPAGVPKTYHSDGTAPAEVMLMLHPAERKEQHGRRAVVGQKTIEGFAEADRRSSVASPSGSEPRFSYSAGTTYLAQFRVHFSDGWGSSEVEFDSCYEPDYSRLISGMQFYGSYCYHVDPLTDMRIYRKTGVDKGKWYYPNAVQINHRGAYISVKVFETDAGDDDYYGITMLGANAAYGTMTRTGKFSNPTDLYTWYSNSSAEMLYQ